MQHLLYLHGLGSSPHSSKAQLLARRLSAHGLTLRCPDLNEPDFSTLTTSRMISQVADELRALPPAPTALIGSSLGAFVALHLVERAASGAIATLPIQQLVLLAPALDFGQGEPGAAYGSDARARWRESGWIEMMHHAFGEMRRVHYELYADATQYDSFATRAAIPTLVFQGCHDEVVDPAMVERFATPRPHVRLVMLNDGHQLKESIDRVWTETASFLGLE